MGLRPTPWGTPLDVITAVRRVNKVLRSRFDRALHGLYLSYAQYEVLLLISTDRNLHAAAVARDLKISPQAVQKLVEKLLLGGLVETLPIDGGVVVLRITHAGRTRLPPAAPAPPPRGTPAPSRPPAPPRAWLRRSPGGARASTRGWPRA